MAWRWRAPGLRRRGGAGSIRQERGAGLRDWDPPPGSKRRALRPPPSAARPRQPRPQLRFQPQITRTPASLLLSHTHPHPHSPHCPTLPLTSTLTLAKMSKEQLPFHNEKDETKSALMGASAEPPVNVVTAAEPAKKMWPGYIIMIWIALSSSVIMQSTSPFR